MLEPPNRLDEGDDDDIIEERGGNCKTRQNPKKRLDVAIVGYPNAGKSQLLNAMLGTKVAAVSKKRHTTRDGVLGVATVQDYECEDSEDDNNDNDNNNNLADVQLVFVDTPGFLSAAEYKDQNIDHDLTVSASHHMANVDYSLVVIDAARSKLTPSYIDTVVTLMRSALTSKRRSRNIDGKYNGPKFAIVLNKVDLVNPKAKLLDMAKHFGRLADQVLLEHWKQQHEQSLPTAKQALRQDHELSTQKQQTTSQRPPFELLPEIFYTSAKKGAKDDGVQDVLQHLCSLAVLCGDEDDDGRQWLLPAGQVTPMDYKGRVAELVREKIYRTLHKEIPHRIEQRTRHLELIRGDDVLSSDKNDDNDSKSAGDTSPGSNTSTTSASSNSSVLLVHQDLIVHTKAHHRLLLKNNQAILQRIHDTAVPELRRLFQCQVLLQLNVKLKKIRKK